MKKYLNLFVSMILIIGSAGLIFFWEFYLDDRINTVGIVVAARNLEKNQVIKEGDVKIGMIKLDQAVEEPITEITAVIGKETSMYVAKGNQFVDCMVDRFGLEPNNNQLIYSIPKEWIYSSPGSLRRKDRVYVYAVSAGQTGQTGQTGQNNPVTAPVLSDIVVAFAKDSANQEVKPAVNSDKRIDATGSINNL